MIGTGLAIYVLVLMVFRARTRRVDLEAAREGLVHQVELIRQAEDAAFRATGGYLPLDDPRLGYRRPDSLLVSLHADGSRGWRAVVGDSGLPVPPRACGVFVGDPVLAPHRATVRPGEPACW